MSNQDDDIEGADIWGDSTSGSGGGAGDSGGSGGDKSAGSSGAGGGSGAQQEPSSSQAQDDEDEILDDETRIMSTTELRQRIHLLDNDIRVMRSDVQRIQHESRGQRERIRENIEKVKLNKQLPYLVGNIVEVLEPEAEDGTWCCSP